MLCGFPIILKRPLQFCKKRGCCLLRSHKILVLNLFSVRFCVFVVCYCNLSWSEHSNCEHYLYLQYASLLTNIFSEFITNFAVFFCIIILQRERGSCLSRSHKILVLYLSLCNSVYPCVIQIAICLWVNEQIAYISYIFSMAFSDKHF